jgi:hypothetical protein
MKAKQNKNARMQETNKHALVIKKHMVTFFSSTFSGAGS